MSVVAGVACVVLAVGVAALLAWIRSDRRGGWMGPRRVFTAARGPEVPPPVGTVAVWRRRGGGASGDRPAVR